MTDIKPEDKTPIPAATISPEEYKPTPLELEYVENLKVQLGELYDAEFDKLSFQERVANMKIVKKTMEKMPKRSEGQVPIQPDPVPIQNQVKNHLERIATGDDLLKNRPTSVFFVTKPK